MLSDGTKYASIKYNAFVYNKVTFLLYKDLDVLLSFSTCETSLFV